MTKLTDQECEKGQLTQRPPIPYATPKAEIILKASRETIKMKTSEGEVKTPTDMAQRIEVVKRRDAFERNPAAFIAAWQGEDARVSRRIVAGRKRLPEVEVPDAALERAATLCMKLGTDGLRGELTLMRAARALAALEGARKVGDEHLRRVAPIALRHRLRRDPLDETGSTARVERAVAEVFPG